MVQSHLQVTKIFYLFYDTEEAIGPEPSARAAALGRLISNERGLTIPTRFAKSLTGYSAYSFVLLDAEYFGSDL